MKFNDLNNKFTVPEGYFEHLQKEILDATSNKATPTAPVHKKVRRIGLLRYIGYAATIAVVTLLALDIMGSKDSDNTTTAPATAQQTDINTGDAIADEEYIDNMLSSYPIDEYTFYCFVTDTNIE